MADNIYATHKRILTIVNKDDCGFEIAELEEANGIIHEYAQRYVIEYIKLRDRFIYKNIPTNVLEDMKLIIENEVKSRKNGRR